MPGKRKKLAAAALFASAACGSLPFWTAIGDYAIFGVVGFAMLAVSLWASGT